MPEMKFDMLCAESSQGGRRQYTVCRADAGAEAEAEAKRGWARVATVSNGTAAQAKAKPRAKSQGVGADGEDRIEYNGSYSTQEALPHKVQEEPAWSRAVLCCAVLCLAVDLAPCSALALASVCVGQQGMLLQYRCCLRRSTALRVEGLRTGDGEGHGPKTGREM